MSSSDDSLSHSGIELNDTIAPELNFKGDYDEIDVAIPLNIRIALPVNNN